MIPVITFLLSPLTEASYCLAKTNESTISIVYDLQHQGHSGLKGQGHSVLDRDDLWFYLFFIYTICNTFKGIQIISLI